MKTILVKPNGNSQYSNLLKFKACEPPIWHAILANYYKADTIVDAEVLELSTEATIGHLNTLNADKVIILATGSHPSAFIQQKEEAEKIKKGVNCEIIDRLPISPIKWGPPRWDLLPMDKYRCHNWHSWTNNSESSPYGVIYTSISCPFKCNFCTIHNFYGHSFEQRTTEDVIADFETFYKMGIKNIKIMDELFIFNKNRVNIICDEIIKRWGDFFNIWAYARIDIMDPLLLKKMRQAGIRWLAYGIECGNDEIRKEALKGNFSKQKIAEVIKMTKDNDICIIGNFMFGFWDDTLETMLETYDLARKLQCEYVNFYCVVAYPETPLHEEMKAKGVALPKSWEQYSQLSKDFLPLRTKTLDASTVLLFRDIVFRSYFRDLDYLYMIDKKFGNKVIHELEELLEIKLNRTC